MTRKATLSVLAAVLLLLCITSLKAASSFDNWDLGSWTVKTIDGESVVCAPDNNYHSHIETRQASDKNQIRLTAKVDSSTATIDGNFGVLFKCNDGTLYFFEYNIVYDILRVRRLGTDGSDHHLASPVPFSIPIGQWFDYEITVSNTNIQWYINGDLKYDIDLNTNELSQGKFRVQGYFCTPFVKNIELRKVENMKKTLDLTFSTPESIDFFKVNNGSLSYENGALKYTFNESSSLVSEQIDVNAGHKYSALLRLRNTILMRIKNASSASKVKISFITSEDMTYDEAKSKVFDLKPGNDYLPYYFNLSDLPGAKGYLKGFKIEPIGGTGYLLIDTIQFEREKPLIDYAGTITSCIANEKDIVIKGTLKPEYANKKVYIYETNIINYNNSLNGLKVVGETVSQGCDFTVKIPFKNGNMTRLSSHFLAVVENKLISEKFNIENYRDFTDNPYKFELPARVVNVTDAPFNAKGDHFTDDTDAIQAAIDYISSQGGGRVVIPGDTTTPEGRRYVVTCIKLKSNVELHIEKGATLWQSQNEDDYKYEVAYGHDVSIPGVNWTHAGLCHNYPLILVSGCENVKITGGGTLRGMDPGSECEDGTNPNTLWIGCPNKIHVILLGMYDSKNVEISDLELIRSNVYHISTYACENVYFGNVTMHEVTCASGDGIGIGIGSKNIVVDRCFLRSNDDGVVLCSSYNEPRGLVWWFPKPDADNCISNIRLSHSCIFGGHGLTFIPWGTDNPDLSKQEISDVVAYDNILGGGYSVGTWCDNPYYGEQPFTNTEEDDYSPVKNVRIYDNLYLAKADLLTIKATNIITDCGLNSASDFQHGDFERKNGQSTWISGLSNWSYEKNSSPNSVGVTKNNGGYCGYISDLDKGNARLYQGLYLTRGKHTINVDLKTSGVTARFFVQNVRTNEIVKSVEFSNTEFKTYEIVFETQRSDTYYIGIDAGSAKSGSAYIDNAKVTTETLPVPKYFRTNMDDDNVEFLDKGIWSIIDVDNNKVLAAPMGNGLSNVNFKNKYKDFDFITNICIRSSTATIDGNIGFLVRYIDDNNFYFLEYNNVENFLRVRKFVNGAPTLIKIIHNYALNMNEWYTMGVRTNGRTFEWYINKELVLSFTDNDSNYIQEGEFRVNAYNVSAMIDDVEIAEVNSIDFSKDNPPIPKTGDTQSLLHLLTVLLLTGTLIPKKRRNK
jgi:hypothetical protein